jgi:uncharacterized protein
MEERFEWDWSKEILNIKKHGVDFETAKLAFKDENRRVFLDKEHSQHERRYYCVGKIGDKILNVRFVYRGAKICIFGAGFWRKGIKFYEEGKI